MQWKINFFLQSNVSCKLLVGIFWCVKKWFPMLNCKLSDYHCSTENHRMLFHLMTENFWESAKVIISFINCFLPGHHPPPHCSLLFHMEATPWRLCKSWIALDINIIGLHPFITLQIILQPFLWKNYPVIIAATCKWPINPTGLACNYVQGNLVAESWPTKFVAVPTLWPLNLIGPGLCHFKVHTINRHQAVIASIPYKTIVEKNLHQILGVRFHARRIVLVAIRWCICEKVK